MVLTNPILSLILAIFTSTLAQAEGVHERFIDTLDRGCATGSCHRAVDGKLPFETLKMFAEQTAPIHQCFETNGCYDATLNSAQGSVCWEACLAGTGGLLGHSGIFHAAIRNGVVLSVMNAAGVDPARSQDMVKMPLSSPPAERDIAASAEDFRSLAAWLTTQAREDFQGIASVRLRSGSVDGVEAACDSFTPPVLRSVTEDFSMEGISMLGCGSAEWPEDPNACLSSFAQADEWINPGSPGLVVKVLRRLEGRSASSFWMRTSPDGRYASTGNGQIEDLKINDRSVQVLDGRIDPAFTPDNKFYIWPNMICPLGPLANRDLTEVGSNVLMSGCVSENVGVYASLGADDTGDVLLISGYSNNNFGGGTRDSSWMPGSEGGFTIRRISGNRLLTDVEPLRVVTPFETDYQISPSGKIMVGRFLRKGGDQAFRIRTLRPDGTTIHPADPNASGVICMKGEKANISFNNRFVTFHHYADGSPQDEGAIDGHANIFVYDIVKKRALRVTQMKDGNKAYFPHFRADGWLIFLVKGADGVETIAASNAALMLQNLP